MLIDEVHLLSETRGSTMEAVVSRLRMLSAAQEMRDVRAQGTLIPKHQIQTTKMMQGLIRCW